MATSSLGHCDGKRSYVYDDAQHAARDARRRTGDRILPYKCDRCRHWHIGHNAGAIRRKSA